MAGNRRDGRTQRPAASELLTSRCTLCLAKDASDFDETRERLTADERKIPQGPGTLCLKH